MRKRSLVLLTGLSAMLLPACGGGGGGGGGGNSGSPGGGSGFSIIEVSNGFGKLLPYRIPVKDSTGLPTNTVIEITRMSDLSANLTRTNPVLPATEWKDTTELPNAAQGNHFIYARFSAPIDIDSVLRSAQSAGVDNNLTGNIQVVSVNALTGETIPIAGRGFVGGMTYGSPNPSAPSQLLLEQWVGPDANGNPVALDVNGAMPGLGFPGTEAGGSFAGSNALVEPNTFVFVADSDANLTSHEMFPSGFQIQMRITKGVRSTTGRTLSAEGVASSTVGDDDIPPEVLVSGATQTPVIIPGGGELGVDPETKIEVFFTEPVQLLTVGDMDDGTPPALSASIQLQFGPSAQKVSVPFTAEPFSVFDLTHIELTPLYGFPGSGPVVPGVTCTDFSLVDVIVNADQFEDLSGNKNTLSPQTFFQTAEGPGLVNCPVVPDAIYVGRGGSQQGISVIDLNGFGQGPGNPMYDPLNPIVEGNSNFQNDPNVAIQGAIMIPPLTPGTCTVDGGSAGVFTLARDSSLNDVVATFPLIESVGDMAIGRPLDNTFNNSQPFGCQAGGGNICAQTGLKVVTIATGGTGGYIPANSAFNAGVSVFVVKTEFGVENTASWAPHPNPPPLVFPPLCTSPLIGGQEPTAYFTELPVPQGGLGLRNLLAPSSSPLGSPDLGVPPQGLLASQQNLFFQGPSPPQGNIAACLNFMIRQQIGHFLYVIDRAASEVVVFNSNRFTVIDRIPLPDPTSLAMSPNLDFMAVTNQGADQISFIDVDPNSSSFHQLVKTTQVGSSPIGIAWTPDNEDILVCNQGENTVSIVSAFTFEVRKVIRNQLRSPFEVAITPRQQAFALSRNVYFAYILNGDGSVALFESGPDGVNGWGFDDTVGTIPFTFDNPKTIHADPRNLNSAVWVVHERQLDQLNPTGPRLQEGGAVTNVAISSGLQGVIPLDSGNFTNPQLRDIEFRVQASIGEGLNGLTGIPVDLAFDDQVNAAVLTNVNNIFSAGTPASINGKSIVKQVNAFSFQTGKLPAFMFAAVPNSTEGPGVVDVFDLDSGFQRFDTNPFVDGNQSIPVSNARVLADYFRQ